MLALSFLSITTLSDKELLYIVSYNCICCALNLLTLSLNHMGFPCLNRVDWCLPRKQLFLHSSFTTLQRISFPSCADPAVYRNSWVYTLCFWKLYLSICLKLSIGCRINYFLLSFYLTHKTAPYILFNWSIYNILNLLLLLWYPLFNSAIIIIISAEFQFKISCYKST